MKLTTDTQTRKDTPMARGLLDYFPKALAAVAHASKVGNDQHNPGEELHWARDKSTDHADCIIRHLVDRGAKDKDGVLHSAKVAWRALALLQTELEKAEQAEEDDDDTYVIPLHVIDADRTGAKYAKFKTTGNREDVTYEGQWFIMHGYEAGEKGAVAAMCRGAARYPDRVTLDLVEFL